MLCMIGSSVQLEAQISSRVVNKERGKPVPYVNIINQRTKTLSTSDFNGRFTVEAADKDTLLFSCIGFEEKKVLYKELDTVVYLIPMVYSLPEVEIVPAKTKTNRIGSLSRWLTYTTHTNLNATQLKKTRFFPFQEECEETPFIRKVRFASQSKVDESLISMSLLEADENGKPGKPIHREQIIVKCHKGVDFNNIEIDSLGLIFPENGLFVVFEWLNLEQNRIRYEHKHHQNKVTEICPELIMEYRDSDHSQWIHGRDGWVEYNWDTGQYLHPQVEVVLSN